MTSVCGITLFIFDIVSCVMWTKLKNSQPNPYYQNNIIVIPIVGFIYALTFLAVSGFSLYSYHLYRRTKDAHLNRTRNESFL